MTELDRKGDALDPFFAALRDIEVPEAGPDLLARVLGDAEAEQARRAVPAMTRGAGARPGLFATFLRAIGGWPAMGGLAAATFAGVWIGVAQPATLSENVSPWLQSIGLTSADDFSLDPVSSLAMTLAAAEG